jgi:arylsulfatase A
MRIRHFHSLGFTACGVLLAVLCGAPTVPAAERGRPNVIIVMTDDQGYGDLGVHGNAKIRTPHLDRFARDGVRFTRFYVSPVCAPTRASLLTGRYHYRTGVIHTSRGGAKMHGGEVTLAERLAGAGYRTGVFGKWHLGDNFPMRPRDQGFGESLVHKSGGIGQTPDKPNSYFDPLLWHNGKKIKAKGYCTDVFFAAALRFIERNREKPFFVYLPTNAPHTPLEVARTYSEPYRKRGLNETTAKVYGMVQNIDENFGRLLAKLDELKLRDDTLLIFLTDNGPQQRRFNAGLRGRKGTTYEGGIRVPCFVQWPAKWKGGRRIDQIAAHIDLLPTVLEACGVKAPGTPATRTLPASGSLPLKAKPKLDGISLVRLLDGTAKDWPDRRLYFQCHRGLIPEPFRNVAVVTQRFKLVGGPGTFARPAKGGAKPVLELYDLAADPSESTNVIAKHPRIARQLEDAYRKWFADVKSTREFTPGVIHVGSEAGSFRHGEDPVHLCRYQDATYRDGVPRGWQVKVVRGGRYRLTFRRDPLKGAGTLAVTWKGRTTRHPLPAGGNAIDVTLSGGDSTLDVRYIDSRGKPQIIRDNSTTGDVTLRFLRTGER